METNILKQLGVGSIIYHRSLGVLVITEKLAPQNEGVGFRMHGQRLFYMEKLIDSKPEENGVSYPSCKTLQEMQSLLPSKIQFCIKLLACW